MLITLLKVIANVFLFISSRTFKTMFYLSLFFKLKETQHEKNSTTSELGYSRSLGKYDYPTQQKVSLFIQISDKFKENLIPFYFYHLFSFN